MGTHLIHSVENEIYVVVVVLNFHSYLMTGLTQVGRQFWFIEFYSTNKQIMLTSLYVTDQFVFSLVDQQMNVLYWDLFFQFFIEPKD